MPRTPHIRRKLEYLGTYPTLDAYFRDILSTLIVPCGLWLLDALDMTAVRARLEAGRFRYHLDPRSHAVLRERL